MPERSNGLGLGPSGLVPSKVRILLPALKDSKMIESLINGYLIFLGFLFILFWIIALFNFASLIYYIRFKRPDYWKKLYMGWYFPRGKIFFKFYFGSENFKDEKIRKLKKKFWSFFRLSIGSFLLILLSVLFLGSLQVVGVFGK